MNVTIDTHSQTAPAQQIVESILDAIAGGVLGAGDRLPSVRGLASQALVNPNTVGKAYRELELCGVVQGRVGAGVFVTEDGPARACTMRRPATLEALRRAVQAARQSGHDAASVRAEVDRALDDSPVAVPTREDSPCTP